VQPLELQFGKTPEGEKYPCGPGTKIGSIDGIEQCVVEGDGKYPCGPGTKIGSIDGIEQCVVEGDGGIILIISIMLAILLAILASVLGWRLRVQSKKTS